MGWPAGYWIVGPVIGLLLGWYAGSGCSTPLQKQERMGGRRGLRPWPLRCLSQFLPERKEKLLREGRIVSRMRAYGYVYQYWRTFHRWGGLVFIVDVQLVGWLLGFVPIGWDIFCHYRYRIW